MALRVALIGCGGVSWAHVRGWIRVADRAMLTAFVDPDVDARRRVRRQYERGLSEAGFAAAGIREYDDYRQALQDAKPGAVDICLPHHLHADCILAACAQRADWMCEKPLCLTLEEAQAIHEAVESSGVIGMPAHNQIFMPALCEAKRLLRDGGLGRVYAISCQDCFIMGLPPLGSLPESTNASPVDPGTWRADRTRMGGGELIDTGYHPVYRLLFLADAEPEEVKSITARLRMGGMEGEDTALIMCAFPGGSLGEIRTSWAMEIPHGQYLFHVSCEHGEVFGNAEELLVRPARMSPARMTFPPVDTFVAEIQHFVECVESRKPPIQTHLHGTMALKLIRRAYESAAQVKSGS